MISKQSCSLCLIWGGKYQQFENCFVMWFWLGGFQVATASCCLGLQALEDLPWARECNSKEFIHISEKNILIGWSVSIRASPQGCIRCPFRGWRGFPGNRKVPLSERARHKSSFSWLSNWSHLTSFPPHSVCSEALY